MSTNKFFDVIVAKEYVAKNNGRDEKKTAWNKVGRAWLSSSGESISLEMFMHPNQRYVIQLVQKNNKTMESEKSNSEAPF